VTGDRQACCLLTYGDRQSMDLVSRAFTSSPVQCRSPEVGNQPAKPCRHQRDRTGSPGAEVV
jgi:hypothetical protein